MEHVESVSKCASANRSDAVLWLELAFGTTREALVERLAQAYLIEDRHTEADFDAFLAELRGQRLFAEP